VHAAGVDSVVPLRELTHSHIADVCAAKVIGAELLDQRTATRPLDMFVCFSSVSAVLGAQGRAHYSAANAFLDGVVDERRRRGLCGTSVNWGPWKGGGMASAAHLDTFERIGNKGLRPEQALDLLDRIVAGGVSRASVMDIDWPTFAGVYQAKRVRPLISEVASAPATTTATDVAPWVAQLRGSAPDDRLSGLQLLLRAEVAETLGFDDAASVPLDRNFYELGLDSLMMADLLGRLRQRTGVSCNAAVFNNPRVAALATALLPTLGVEETIVPLAPKEQASDASRLPVSDGTERYRADAESEILEFQSLAFPTRPRELSDARWRWMFVDSARRLNREPRFWVHRDGGRIVGQTGSIAVRLKVGEQQHDTGWLVDSMVLADHRSQAVGSRILVDAHDDQPLSLSLGQTAEVRQILYRLGWRQVGPLQIAQALVRPEQVLKGKLPTPAAWAASVGLRTANALRNALGERQPLRANPVDRFAERHDVLWADASSEVRCGVVRDASYLNWKYVDQPGQQFLRLELFDGQALRGVAVWMFRDADAVYRYRRAFLVDLVAPFGDEAVLVRVVKAAARVAADHGADALLCHHISTPLTRALRACGFHLRDPERYLLVDAGPLAGDAREALLTAEGWLVTQGDSDIDRPW
jgi:acyl carrier protein